MILFSINIRRFGLCLINFNVYICCVPKSGNCTNLGLIGHSTDCPEFLGKARSSKLFRALSKNFGQSAEFNPILRKNIIISIEDVCVCK